MTLLKRIVFVLIAISGSLLAKSQVNQDSLTDLKEFKYNFAALDYYQTSNNTVLHSKRRRPNAIFIGNSITEMWFEKDSSYFLQNNFLDRGISGQTSSQILLRFRQDVINLQPKVVFILCGINDIAENTGPITVSQIAGNIFDMAELAKSNHIRVYLCSVLPSNHIFWNASIRPENKIIELNNLLKLYATQKGCTYVNYYDKMVDEKKGLRQDLTIDGVHCNLKGYKIMESVVKSSLK